MARVIVTPEAFTALDRLIVSHSLPADTKERLRRSLRPLETFPRLGRELDGGGYEGLRPDRVALPAATSSWFGASSASQPALGAA